IKTTLRQAGIEVADYPDDGLPLVEPDEISQQAEDSKAVEDDFTIVNAADIIDATVSQVEARLGVPLTSQKRSIMGSEDLPHGGETREYRSGKYRFAVNFSKRGTATGITITEGLIDEHYTLEHWPVIFSRLGIV